MSGFPNNQGNPAGAIPVWMAGGGAGGAPFPGAVFKGYQQILAATLAAPTALTVPTGSTVAQVMAEGGNVRYIPGASPVVTGSAGFPLWATQPVSLSGALATYQFINMTANSAILNILYWGPAT